MGLNLQKLLSIMNLRSEHTINENVLSEYCQNNTSIFNQDDSQVIIDELEKLRQNALYSEFDENQKFIAEILTCSYGEESISSIVQAVYYNKFPITDQTIQNLVKNLEDEDLTQLLPAPRHHLLLANLDANQLKFFKEISPKNQIESWNFSHYVDISALTSDDASRQRAKQLLQTRIGNNEKLLSSGAVLRLLEVDQERQDFVLGIKIGRAHV